MSDKSRSQTKKRVLVTATWYAPALLYGIRAFARKVDWQLVMQFPAVMARPASPFDGVLALVNEEEFIDVRAAHPRACIVDMRGTKKLKADAVVRFDNEAIGEMAADYLRKIGCRSFLVFCSAILPEPVFDQRMNGFRKRLEALGLKQCTHKITCATSASSYSPQVVAQFRRVVRRSELPLGVFTPTDHIADCALQNLLSLGLKVPEEAAVLGVNNDRGFCEMAQIPLSSVEVRLSHLGYESASVLDRLLSGNKKVPPVTLIPPFSVEARRSTEGASNQNELVRAIQEYIGDHFHEAITVDDVIHAAHVSRSIAFMRFRKATGHSIGFAIEACRMERAKTHLLDPNIKIDAIAKLCGYKDTSTFCRAFKRFVGKTPTTFRVEDSFNSDGGT